MGFKSLDEVNRLTIPEYNLLMEALELREVDKDYRIHQQAFLNFAVQAKRKSGKNKEKPVYTSFKKFFNYDRAIKSVKKNKQPNRFSGIGKLLSKGR